MKEKVERGAGGAGGGASPLPLARERSGSAGREHKPSARPEGPHGYLAAARRRRARTRQSASVAYGSAVIEALNRVVAHVPWVGKASAGPHEMAEAPPAGDHNKRPRTEHAG